MIVVQRLEQLQVLLSFSTNGKELKKNEEGIVSLDTTIRGTCDKTRLMDIFENFNLNDDGGDVVKIMAKITSL